MKVLVGSLSGMIRIFLPRGGPAGGHTLEDLVLEKKLDGPILQLLAGRYAVSAVKAGGVAAYFNIQQVATAAVIGISFHYRLPYTKISPRYLMASGQFITVNSEMTMESYRYSILAAAGDNVDHMQMSGKRLTADWRTNLGDHISWLGAARFDRGPLDVVALGDQTLFVVDYKGRVKSQRRLEYPCTSAHVCAALHGANDKETTHQLLIGTQTGHILVLRERALVWCCLVGPSPITAIIVAEFGDTMGMICSLDDAGLLQVSYLGTDPPVASTMVNTDTRALDYDHMEAEHRQLVNTIKQYQKTAEDEDPPPQVRSSEVTVSVSVPPTIDPPSSVDLSVFQDGQDQQGLYMVHDDFSYLFDRHPQNDGLPQQLTVDFEITNTDPRGREARGLTLTVQPLSDAVVTMTTKTMALGDVQAGGSSMRVSLSFYVSAHVLCSNRSVELVAVYTLGDILQFTTRVFELPLCFVARLIPPTKEANFKVAIGASAIPPTLADIFQDFLEGSLVGPEGTVRNALSMRLTCGKDVTILQSKTSSRFCVQSSDFGPLWVGLAELDKRCREFFNGDFKLTYLDSLPLQDYFALLDDHFSIRHHLQGLRLAVDKESSRYRDNQKQLLTRLKDKQPTDLNGIDELLEVTYGGLIEVLDEIEDARTALRVIGGDLAAATELMIGLMQWRFDMGHEDVQYLRRVLSSTTLLTAADAPTTDFDLPTETEATHLMAPTQGWQERTECAISQLLKTAAFSKSGQDEVYRLGQCRIAADTSRLKKLMTRLIERLAHGARPTARRE
ncbi:hypothetical protein Pmar_PMAR018805 [Perkinsus marinus ATCC 50983]|uniref:Uncharacterized protein n=1 Tax=Perkinsus marinus (strain ATCC 50983 / TXsc) TaxID=423536 RepID=C5KJE9_PERM5|nr:hypothetical protein Pmar_PMAR018805 [Perkinsus marinus ATCC 50983]EER15451.1 hypothetical protein Pmar_PMAR018805 [Perkinsus marinus ATCC 50983]|eukprot:XP_002783655.1 hypothetical protein Pmar_PMAR018805 [Perkinsus marinus ATCC 50983]